MTPSFPDPPDLAFGPITRTDIVRYAGASGDFNPLHHDEIFAREAGLDSVMAHGMLSAGLLASFLSAWAGRRHVRRYRVRFLTPVWPGDTLRAEGRMVRAVPESSPERVELSLRLVRSDGVEVVSGTAEVERHESGTRAA